MVALPLSLSSKSPARIKPLQTGGGLQGSDQRPKPPGAGDALQFVQDTSTQETTGIAWPNRSAGIISDLAGETQSTVDRRRADKSMMNADFRFSLLLVILNCFPPSDNSFMYFSRTEA